MVAVSLPIAMRILDIHAIWINPGRGINMGDGWETKRRRAPGFDWCILALGASARIEKIEIDTAHFKGNFPAEVSIQAIYVEDATDEQLIPQSMFWPFC